MLTESIPKDKKASAAVPRALVQGCAVFLEAGGLEHWSAGVLEYWSIGVLEYWEIGKRPMKNW
jgi:hypothetical protein